MGLFNNSEDISCNTQQHGYRFTVSNPTRLFLPNVLRNHANEYTISCRSKDFFPTKTGSINSGDDTATKQSKRAGTVVSSTNNSPGVVSCVPEHCLDGSLKKLLYIYTNFSFKNTIFFDFFKKKMRF